VTSLHGGAELGRVVEQAGACVRYARLSSFEDALAEALAWAGPEMQM
jgi:hypothetical protein